MHVQVGGCIAVAMHRNAGAYNFDESFRRMDSENATSSCVG